MSFLTEYYAPFVQLSQSPENRKLLMKFGITKNSKLEKIYMTDAKTNTDDLILFRNAIPSNEDSVWIGYKKGDEFEVWRPKESGGRDLKHLYKSDHAYKVTLERKEILKKQYRAEHPERKEPITITTNLKYKLYSNKIITLMGKAFDILIDGILDNFDKKIILPIKEKKLKDTNFDIYIDKHNLINSLILLRNDLDKNKDKINSEKIEKEIKKISEKMENI